MRTHKERVAARQTLAWKFVKAGYSSEEAAEMAARIVRIDPDDATGTDLGFKIINDAKLAAEIVRITAYRIFREAEPTDTFGMIEDRITEKLGVDPKVARALLASAATSNIGDAS